MARNGFRILGGIRNINVLMEIICILLSMLGLDLISMVKNYIDIENFFYEKEKQLKWQQTKLQEQLQHIQSK